MSDRRLQRAQVKARAHAVRPPELDVVGVVMRLLHHALVPGIPRLDAVVQAPFHLRPQPAQPFGVAADAPLAVHLHDAPKLPVGGGVEVVRDGANRQGAAELLVPRLVLRRAELGLAQRPLQAREEVRDGLGVIPDVRAGAVAAARIVAATFPGPQLAVGLAHDRGRLQDRQVRRHRFDDLGRQGGIIKAIAEPAASSAAVRRNDRANRR